MVKDTFPPSNGMARRECLLTTVLTISEWKPYNFAHKVPFVVARLSSLVFMGDKVCRDQDWINVSVNYTIDAFTAARELRMWPSILRPLVHWFLPSMQKLRRHLTTARSIVNREIEKRQMIRDGKLPLDDPPRTHADALDWFEELSAAYNQPFDRARGQVGLSMAAIHTTSNLLTNIVYDLAAHPEYIQPLRDEILAVVEEDGSLKKTSLLKLKLMDSVMKESQRIHPVAISESPFPAVVSTAHSHFGPSFHEPRRLAGNSSVRRHRDSQRCDDRGLRTHQRGRVRLPQRKHLRRLPLLQEAAGTRQRAPLPTSDDHARELWVWPWDPRLSGPLLCCQRVQDPAHAPAAQVRLEIQGCGRAAEEL